MLLPGGIDVSLWILCPGFVFTFLFTFVFLYTAYKRITFAMLGYPTFKTKPLVGDIPDIIKEGQKENQLTQLRECGKVYGKFTGNMSTLVVADPDMIKEMFVKDFASFPNRNNFGQLSKAFSLVVSNSQGDHWKFLRTTLSPIFSTGKLKNMVPLIHKCLDTFVECVEERLKVTDTLDVQEAFGALTMDIICQTSLGIDVNSQRNENNSFVKYAKRAMNLFGDLGGLIVAIFPDFAQTLANLGFKFADEEAAEFLETAVREAMVARRKQRGAEHRDPLQHMLNSQTEQDEQSNGGRLGQRPMRDEEIIANAVGFLLGGYDTTASAITWTAYCLATNPDAQDRLVEEIEKEVGSKSPSYETIGRMPYLDMVVSESLRLYPPAPSNSRVPIHDVTLSGYRIPRGLMVTIPIYGLHRLDEYWPEPDKFLPERFSPEKKATMNPYTYLPFGIGPRNCIAMRLALLEVKMTIVTLLQRFRISPSESTTVPPKFSPSIFTKPLNGMPLKIEKRCH